MSDDHPTPYRVDMSGLVHDQFRAMWQAAKDAGRWPEVGDATRTLYAALTWVPETVAERCYFKLPLGWVHAGSHGSIQLRFAVNDERRYVVVAFVRLLPPDHD